MISLLGILSALVLVTADDKSSPVSYSVRSSIDGCYSSFRNLTTHLMDGRSSNLRCQEICRDDGYILAATQGPHCHCGNDYPSGKRLAEDQCSTKCRTYTKCYGAQSCCGGPDAFSMNAVGDLEVTKMVLKRLAHVWRTNTDYRNHSMEFATSKEKFEVKAARGNWWSSLDHGGQSYCDGGLYMNGVLRSDYKWGDERIGRLEEGECLSPPSYLQAPLAEDQECYEENIRLSFDHEGWGSCKESYYMAGLVSTRGEKLNNIEALRCCRPKRQNKTWRNCYELDTSNSMSVRGWSKCDKTFYMAGMYRSDCYDLGCIERFKCCQMSDSNGVSFKENPTISIKMKDGSGEFQECSIKATDNSTDCETCQCTPTSSETEDPENKLELKSESFKIQEIVSEPKPIAKRVKHFQPLVCSSFSTSYTCTRTLSTKTFTSTIFVVASGFAKSAAVTMDYDTKYSERLRTNGFMRHMVGYNTEVFDTTSSKFMRKQIEEKSTVSVKVPANEQAKIDLLRQTANEVAKWKGEFKVYGKYTLSWDNNDILVQDISSALEGHDLSFYTFDTWRYASTDILNLSLTGSKRNQRQICAHNVGDGRECNMSE